MTEVMHAKIFAPSAFHRRKACPGSAVLEADEPDTENVYSREGSIAHAVAAHCLENNVSTDLVLTIPYRDKIEPISQDMREILQGYIEHIQKEKADGVLMTEQRLELEYFTGEKDAKGTADVVILSADGKTLKVWDLKYGFGEVEAEDNPQLRIYSLCALRQFEMLGDFETVISGIYQPRIGNVVSETLTVAELKDFEQEVRATVAKVHEAQKSNSLEGYLHPSKKACQWCKARHKCPALTNDIAQATGADFDDETQTKLVEPVDAHKALLKADLIEAWVRGLRAKIEADLLAGQPSRYWKLVEGKKGNRDWVDEADAEKGLTALKIPEDILYDKSLRSPAQLEKKLKSKPEIWEKAKAFYRQKTGKPSVASIDDPRTKYDPKPAADFEEVTE